MSSSSPAPQAPSSPGDFVAFPPSDSEEAGFEVPIALHPHSPALLNAFFPDGTTTGIESRVRGVAAPKLETIRKMRDRGNQKHTDIREFLPSLPSVDREKCDLVMLGAGLENSRCAGHARSWEKVGGGGVVVPVGMVPSLMCVDRGSGAQPGNRAMKQEGFGGVGRGNRRSTTMEQGWVDGTFQPPPVICDAVMDTKANLPAQTQDSGNGSGGDSGGVPYRIVGVQGSSEQKGGFMSGRKRGGAEPPSKPDVLKEKWAGNGFVRPKRCLCIVRQRGAPSGCSKGGEMKVSGSSNDSAKQEGSMASGSDGMFCLGGVRYVPPSMEISPPVVEMTGPGSFSGKQFQEDVFQASRDAPLVGSDQGGVAESEETQTDSCQLPQQNDEMEEVASKKSMPVPDRQFQTFTAREIDIQMPPWADSMVEKLIRLDVSLNVAKRNFDVRRLLVILDYLLHLPIAFTSLKGCAIGETVKGLRQHKHPEVAKIASILIRVWRWLGAQYLKRVSSGGEGGQNKGGVGGRKMAPRGKSKLAVRYARKTNLRQKDLKSIVCRLETVLCDLQ
ncbi:hypothetical protein BSKO_11892 [Bryopsis sp. KO-2023]|nr:hypothetical protein BSKO_11892 [Bryopsis sp. KO-2023]